MISLDKIVLGRPVSQWLEEHPVLWDVCQEKETCWRNEGKLPYEQAAADCALTRADIEDAAARLGRFASYFQIAFPETKASGGILESPIREIPKMKWVLEADTGVTIPGKLWIKLDSHLPISGSIKARGGIYEVLKTAEEIALKERLLQPGDDYSVFNSDAFQNLFSKYSIAVGSTGNLGLSIGIMGAKLGFRVTVHMSADARQWKKDLLREKGVNVIEYASDYSVAVAEGRRLAEGDPYCHFVDDENSKKLFLGYTVAALRLKGQLAAAGISVDREHPLFVYLPCGVGGGPGGVAFGLKMVFGDFVHCFFAEPTHSCCMLLGMVTGENSALSVQDFGLDNRTIADGLAVGRASGFVGSLMAPFLSGCYSLCDERMYQMLAQLANSEGLYLEPSALAGMYGPVQLVSSQEFSGYIQGEKLTEQLAGCTHLVWATGGSMVPPEEMRHYYEKGRAYLV